jgi:hypothetical protein
MKVINCLATVLMLSGICRFGLAQTSPVVGNGTSVSAAPGYTITLTEPTNPFSLDLPILVTMTIKNITGGDIFWRAFRGTDKDSWYPDFRYLLKKDGKEAETTFFHRKISGRQRSGDPAEVSSGSTILLPKPPGTMFVITVDLKHLYQITEPGQYTLEISRVAEDDKTFVHSNTVTLNIVP